MARRPKPQNSLHAAIVSAVAEKDVENVYRSALVSARPDAVSTSPHGCDGLITWTGVRLLVEFKLDVELKSRTVVAGVLGQATFYLRRFVEAGEPLPNVILIADRNECCVLPTSLLAGFLSQPFDWSAAPSTGDPKLVQAIASTTNYMPHVYDVNARFDFAAVVDKIEALAEGATHTIRATLANVDTIFGHWRESVFRGKLPPVDQVDVFLRCLFDPVEVYLHPKRKGMLVVPGYPDGVQVHADRYQAFFDTFTQGYRPSEVEAFYAAKDRLIDDDTRRRQGAFFTPRIWVDEAHRTIESVLGPTWRDDCIVWDPAAGTGNLTRDYTFADLILSTAERSDVETIKAQGYNPGASVFQYDFLNPDVPSPFFGGDLSTLPASVDARLRAAAKAGKRLVFLMNPPYAESGGGASSNSRKGVASMNVVSAKLRAAKTGRASRQLYAQFMYQAAEIAREYGFTARTVAVFCKPTFMTSESYRVFRSAWYSDHAYRSGFVLQASHFADVSGAWGISFTVWSEGQTQTNERLAINLTDVEGCSVMHTTTKALYSSQGRSMCAWLGSTANGDVDTPKLSSGLTVKGDWAGGQAPGSFATLCSNGNSLSKSATDVYLLSCKPSNHGIAQFECQTHNVRRCVTVFTARKLVVGTWVDFTDEYLAPDESRDGYAQWVDDAHVFALLHPSNNCTAMRDVDYSSRKWTISNHLFWRSRVTCLADLDTSHTLALYRDCKAHPAGYVVPPPEDAPRESWEIDGDPYLAHVLPTLDLSPEARDVLERLDALWLASLPVREAFALARPELHLLAWDAGVYQLKHLWREHFPAEWEALRVAHRKLADRLRPGVYDFGFLLR